MVEMTEIEPSEKEKGLASLEGIIIKSQLPPGSLSLKKKQRISFIQKHIS